MDVQAYISERTPLVDRELETFLPPLSQEPRSLHQAMRHLVFPGGKRIRPLFAMAAAEAIGAAPERALPVAVAVELIHTYSLIHDDLPCMDDDDLRRGRPTVHVEHGEAVAVLAGDALLTAAFEAVGAAAGSHGAEPAVVAIRELARVARCANGPRNRPPCTAGRCTAPRSGPRTASHTRNGRPRGATGTPRVRTPRPRRAWRLPPQGAHATEPGDSGLAKVRL